MSKIIHEIPESINERNFKEFVQRGDDFFKIELLRPAKVWYKKAAELNIEAEMVNNKIAECDRLLFYERKIVRILIAITSLLILGYFILLK